MIIACPECASRYAVPDASIGTAGRTVRCAKCAHSWFQAPSERPPEPKPVPAPTPESVLFSAAPDEPLPPVPELPSPVAHGKIPIANLPMVIRVKLSTVMEFGLLILAVFTLMIGVLAYRQELVSRFPFIAFFFEPLGIYAMDGISLADISVTKKLEEGKPTKLVVDCTVLNEAKGSRTLPPLRIVFYKADGREVARSMRAVDSGKNMTPGSAEPCAQLAVEAAGVDTVSFDLGTISDIAVRK